MAKYQAYAEYKDSGAEWLGNIPKHWSVEYSKWLFAERNIKASVGDEMLTASQKYGVIPQKMFMELEQQKVVQVQLGHEILKRAEVNDFVISMRSFQGGIEYCGYKGAVSSAYVPLKPRQDLSISYYKYLFKSIPYIQALQTTTNLVRDGQALRFANFIQVRIPLLPYSEAEKIGQFLDHETAKIDHLIEKQQQLIELLKEKRQAVISHAVTKGLDPNVPMKDSGVEWLGEVPEHWEIRRLKTIICSLESGCSVNAADIPAQSHELGVLKTSCVYTRSFRVEENKTVVPEDIQRVKCKVRKGSIIISRMNTPELVGASALVKVKADNIYLPDRLWQTIFFENIEIDAEYLSHFMTVQGFRDQIALGAEGASSSMQNIAKEDYLNINCLLPPLKEQILIREFIEQKLSILNHLNIKAQEAVDRLKERRTALISSAVTGKIDVRNWQAPTLAEADTELSA